MPIKNVRSPRKYTDLGVSKNFFVVSVNSCGKCRILTAGFKAEGCRVMGHVRPRASERHPASIGHLDVIETKPLGQ